MSLILHARDFAAFAHWGHVRDGTKAPYITHPANVATTVRAYWPDAPDEVVAAAWLHDTVEDTWVTLDDIHSEFGPAVAALVAALTKPGLHMGNRAARTAMFSAAVNVAGKAAATVKLADRLDNLSDDWSHHPWPKFVKRYLAETAEALSVYGHHHPALALEVARAAVALSVDRVRANRK